VAVSATSPMEGTLAASFIGTVAVHFRENIVNIGVLHSVIGTLSRLPLNEYRFRIHRNGDHLQCNSIWSSGVGKKRNRAESPPILFALLTVLFYICEQLGVGGNVPFYDRYVFPLAPLWVARFSLVPKLTYPRLSLV